MKNLITLILAVICSTTIAYGQTNVQDSLTGFWGIPFGCSESKAVEILKQKRLLPTKGFLSGVKELQTLTLDDANFGNRKSLSINLLFANNKFCRAKVYYDTDTPHIMDDFESVKKNLEAKYSQTETLSKFKSPYEKGDGHEETALRLGYAELICAWLFNNNSNIILATKNVKSGVYLEVCYQDDKLIGEAITLQNKNNDF